MKVNVELNDQDRFLIRFICYFPMTFFITIIILGIIGNVFGIKILPVFLPLVIQFVDKAAKQPFLIF